VVSVGLGFGRRLMFLGCNFSNTMSLLAVHQFSRCLLLEVSSLLADATVLSAHKARLFTPPSRPPFLPREGLLCRLKRGLGAPIVARVLDRAAIIQGSEVQQAHIKAHHLFGWVIEQSTLYLTGENHIPVGALALDGACFDPTFRQTVPLHFDIADLREAQAQKQIV